MASRTKSAVGATHLRRGSWGLLRRKALPMLSQRTQRKLRQVHPSPTFAGFGSETPIREERQPDRQRVRFIRTGNFPLRWKLRGRTARMATEA